MREAQRTLHTMVNEGVTAFADQYLRKKEAA
jgi:hypothetical protein